jgi:hypothetical protein
MHHAASRPRCGRPRPLGVSRRSAASAHRARVALLPLRCSRPCDAPAIRRNGSARRSEHGGETLTLNRPRVQRRWCAPDSVESDYWTHATGIDDGVVVAVADGSHGGHQSRLLGAGEAGQEPDCTPWSEWMIVPAGGRRVSMAMPGALVPLLRSVRSQSASRPPAANRRRARPRSRPFRPRPSTR